MCMEELEKQELRTWKTFLIWMYETGHGITKPTDIQGSTKWFVHKIEQW